MTLTSRILRRLAPLLAGVALLAFAAPASAEKGRSTIVRVAATILSYVKVAGLANPAALDVAPADVARGYVDLDAATSLSLVTNSSDGYLISAHCDPSTVAHVSIRVVGQAGTDVGLDRLHVPSIALVKTALRIGYRLHLSPGIAAGRYPWPVALSVGKG